MSVIDILAWIVSPFAALMSADGDLHWPHVVGFFLVGAAVWALRPDMAKGRGLFAYLFPPAIYATPSAQLDLRFFVVNTLVTAALIAPIALTTEEIARGTLAAMTTTFGVPDAPWESGPLTAVLAAAFIAVAADLGFFIGHLMQHKIPALWAFHKSHHAAEVLHPLTAFRAHPVDMLVDFACMGATMGLATAIIAYLFDANLTPATLLGVNAFVFAFRAIGSHLRHSHIWLDYGPYLSRVLISPAMHQLHHSAADEHRDRNLGGMLSIWDWMARTLFIPKRERTPLILGLAHGESLLYRSVLDLYLRPFEELRDLTRRGPRQPRLPKMRTPTPPKTTARRTPFTRLIRKRRHPTQKRLDG